MLFIRSGGHAGSALGIAQVVLTAHDFKAAADKQHIRLLQRLVVGQQFFGQNGLALAFGDIQQKRPVAEKRLQRHLPKLFALCVKMVRPVHMRAVVVEQLHPVGVAGRAVFPYHLEGHQFQGRRAGESVVAHIEVMG